MMPAVRMFNLVPFIGAPPIAFGMARPDVIALLGPPNATIPPGPWNGLVDAWGASTVQIRYDDAESVNHVSFIPGDFTLMLSGSPLWDPANHPDPNPSLLRIDPSPREVRGILIFDRIGVTTSGYLDGDPGQRSLSVYPRGTWDEPLRRSTAPDLSRYALGR